MNEQERKLEILKKKKRLLELKAQAQAAPKQEADSFFGARYIEPALTMGSSVAASTLGGLSSLWPTVVMEDPQQGERNIRSMQEMLTYQPRTPEGRKGLTDFAEFAKPATDIMQTVEDKFSQSGAESFERAGLPPALGAGTGAIMPELLGMALGGTALSRRGAKPPTRQQLGYQADPTRAKLGYEPPHLQIGAQPQLGAPPAPQLPPQPISPWQLPKKKVIGQRLAQQQQIGGDDLRIAGYKLSDKGRTVKDSSWTKYANQAKEAGFDEGALATLKNASRADKDRMLTMVDDMETALFDKKKALRTRPGNRVGEVLKDRVKTLTDLKEEAGSQLDDVARSLKPEQADFTPAINSFINKLDDMGIKLGDDLTPDFRYSDIEGLDSAEKALTRVIKRLKADTPGKTPSAYDMHRLKRYIDNNVSYDKSGDGLIAQVENIVKDLRHDVDNILDTRFPEYNRVNTQYADTITALDSLQSSVGKRLDFNSKYADSALGQELRKLTSNYKSRNDLMESMDVVEDTLRKYGKEFDSDIDSLVVFNNMIDEAFDPIAGRSLRGEVGKANIDAAIKMAEAARGQKTVLGMGADAAAWAGKKAFKPDRAKEIEDQLNTLRELLKQ